MRGRKPKPTAEKRRRGNPGKRALNRTEPTPPTDAAFEAPPPMIAADVRALAEWHRLAPALRKARIVTDADRSALIAVCLEWSLYAEAKEKVLSAGLVVRSPNDYPMTNPYLPIANRALGNCIKLWAELGCTPSSRSRVEGHRDPVEDPIEAALEDDGEMPIPSRYAH